MCDWLHQIDIAKYDFRSAPMTKDKQDTTVYETRSEGHMTRAVFELTDLADKPYLFIAAEVAGYFKLSDGDGQAALRLAGYVADQRSHKGQRIRCWVQPKYLHRRGLRFRFGHPIPILAQPSEMRLTFRWSTRDNTYRLCHQCAECG